MHTKRKTKLLHKEKLRTTIKCPPEQRMVSKMGPDAPGETLPLGSGRLAELQEAGLLAAVGSAMPTQCMALRCPLPLGSSGVLGQPDSNGLRLSLRAGTLVCNDPVPNEKIPAGFC